jgi:hypothetical protein
MGKEKLSSEVYKELSDPFYTKMHTNLTLYRVRKCLETEWKNHCEEGLLLGSRIWWGGVGEP